MTDTAPEILTKGFDLVDLDELMPHPQNPNQGEPDAISAAIDEIGFYGAVLAQLPRGRRKRLRILAGEHRWRGARQSGLEQVPTLMIDCDDETALKIMIGDNEFAARGRRDPERMLELLGGLKSLTATGVTPEARKALEERVANMRHRTKDLDVADPDAKPAKPITKTGDVWILGDHRLVCGDSLNPEIVSEVMGTDRAQMVLTDPPYGVAYSSKAGSIAHDDLDVEGLTVFLEQAFRNGLGVSKPGAVWFVYGPGGAPTVAFTTALSTLGIFRQTLIWVKDRASLTRSDYQWRHEMIFYGCDPTGGHELVYYGWNPAGGHRRPQDRTQTTVWEFAMPAHNPDHPTMKPVEMLQAAVLNHTNPGRDRARHVRRIRVDAHRVRAGGPCRSARRVGRGLL